MRKFKTQFIVIIISVLTASIAYAGVFTYSPPVIDIVVPAGESQTVDLDIYMNDQDGNPITQSRFYYVRFIKDISGDLPTSWISSSLYSSWSIPASTELTFAVPADAQPGVYSGSIYSWGFGGGHGGDNDGVFVSLSVPSVCTGQPKFEISSFGPAVIWPPSNATVMLTIKGRVVLPEGCELFEFGYGLEDEYGVLTRMGEMGGMDIDSSGAFSLEVPVEASRHGSDRDGRVYGITLFASDEEGNTTLSDVMQAVVPHDRRSK